MSTRLTIAYDGSSSAGTALRVAAGLFPSAPGETHKLVIVDRGSGVAREVTLTSASITSVPVKNLPVIETATGKVGYLVGVRYARFEQSLTANFLNVGTETREASVEDVAKLIKVDADRWARVISTNNIPKITN